MSEGKGGLLNIDFSKSVESLKNVDTPIKLCALAVLTCSVVLVTAFFQVKPGALQSALIVLLSVVIAIFPVVTILLESKKLRRQGDIAQASIEYGAFISAPMDTTNGDRDWDDHRRKIQLVTSALIEHCGMTQVFYAGDSRPQRRWQTPDIALRENIKKLRASNKFVMIYPRKAASSILVEIGMALALGKDTVIFTKKLDELPYLLRGSANASNQSGLPHISVYTYTAINEIVDKIRNDGLTLFG